MPQLSYDWAYPPTSQGVQFFCPRKWFYLEIMKGLKNAVHDINAEYLVCVRGFHLQKYKDGDSEPTSERSSGQSLAHPKQPPCSPSTCSKEAQGSHPKLAPASHPSSTCKTVVMIRHHYKSIKYAFSSTFIFEVIDGIPQTPLVPQAGQQTVGQTLCVQLRHFSLPSFRLHMKNTRTLTAVYVWWIHPNSFAKI